MSRSDDFETRRKHLANLDDEALYQRFWELADQIVEPMLEAGKIYTSPSVERSVLLRMGFSSIEAKAIVDGLMERELLGHGAGNAVWKWSVKKGVSVREAGVALASSQDWEQIPGLFEEGASDA